MAMRERVTAYTPALRSTRDGARDTARQLVQVGRDAPQLLRDALQLPEGVRLLARARRHLLRAFAVVAREGGDAANAIAQARECKLLLARRQRDALRSGRGAGRGLDDEVERLARLLGQHADVLHDRLGARHLEGDAAHLL